jgi:hypothetical protein
MKKAMMSKVLPSAVVLVVIAFLVLPGLAFGAGKGGGGGTQSPPPSNPPCDSDHHNGQPPPYGGPKIHSLMCKLQRTTGNGTGHSTGNGTGNATGNACPPNSKNPGGTPPDCGHPSPSPSPSPSGGTTGPTTTTGGAVCGTQLDGLPIFLHIGGAPDQDTGQLVHVCAQLGGTHAPTEPCPDPPPLEIRPNSDDPSLAVCVLL